MRNSVAASALVHVLLLVGLFAFQSRAPRLMMGPEVIQLALLEPTSMSRPVAAAAPTPPPVEKTAPKIEAEKGTGVKLAPPPKPKAKPETTPPKPAPTEPSPPLALASAPMGRAGLSGDVAVDAGNFEFNYYLLLLRNRIAQNWSPPAGLVAGAQPIRAVVFFQVDREGRVRNARIESPSGSEFFDRSAQRAIVLSDPLPPLPAGYTGSQLGVHFGFDYTAP